MFRSNIKQFFKLLGKSKFFTFLNLFGISITIMIIMIMDIQIENKIWPGGPEKNNNQMAIIKNSMIKGEDITRIGGVNLNLIHQHLENIKSKEYISFTTQLPWTYVDEYKVNNYSLKFTNSEFWQVFEFNFIAGRGFNPEEEKNASKVAVINEEIKGKLYSDVDPIGKTIEISGEIYTIIGLVENISYTCINSYSDIWIPYTCNKREPDNLEQTGAYDVVFYLGDKYKIDELENEIREIESKVSSTLDSLKLSLNGPYNPVDAYFIESRDSMIDDRPANTFIWKTILKWFIILLLPAINLISVSLTRINERSEEIAVRKAFGASKTRLIKQIIFENSLLTILGSFLGFGMAVLGTEIFKKQLFTEYFAENVSTLTYQINFSSFLICMFTALFLAILSGIIPAIRMSKLQPAIVLKGGEI